MSILRRNDLTGWLLLVGALLLAPGPVNAGETDAPAPARVTLDDIIDGDPHADAERSFQAGDARLWAISGFGIRVPGLPEGCRARLFGLRMLPELTDSLTPRTLRLGGPARDYAGQYNRQIIALADANGQSVCRGKKR